MKDGGKDLVAHLVDESRIEQTPRAEEGGKRIMPEIAMQSVAVIRHAAARGDHVVITGPSGTLKTTAALAAAAEIAGSLYACINMANASQWGVVKVVGEAMGLSLGERPNVSISFGKIESILRRSGRLLIVDNFDKLACWRKDAGLHLLRDLRDSTGIAMAWIGTTAAARYIRDRREQGMESIYSRIGLWLDLTEAASQVGGGPGGDGAAGDGAGLVTVEDVRRMLAARKLRYTGGALHYLVMLGREDGAGAFRTIDKVLAFAEVVARGGEITEELLRGIQARRLGLRAAEVLEHRIALRMPQKAVG